MRICPHCKTTFEQDFRVCPFDGATLTQNQSPPADPMIGRVLDERFRIVQKIGQGGMGAVYKAVHTQMDRICAIKLLSPLSADKESAVVRFQREAKMASRIDSPNAVTIYDFGEAEPGLLYLAMEFVEGESLSQVLARERSLPVDRVVNITSQVARALSAAHALGIVHRDLKPDNIMLTRKSGEEERVKVLDFGIAKTITDGSAENLTQTGFVLGTPVYMSPEQVLGESVDSRSDVYSLSIIVYQMLSGRVPFEGNTPQTVMMKRVTTEPHPLRLSAPSVSESIEHVVMSGLARNPENRIRGAQEFATALSAAAMSGTQLIGSRPTNLISESRGGDNSNSSQFGETRLAGTLSADADKTVPIAGQRSTSAESDETLVMQSEDPVGKPAPKAPPQPVSSPSLYVTRPATGPVPPPPQTSGSSDLQPPDSPPVHAAPALVEFRRQRGPVQPDPWAQQGATSPLQSPSTSGSSSKAPYLLFAALGLIVIVGLAAGGYYYLMRPAPTPPAVQQPTQTPQPSGQQASSPPPAGDSQVADEHYRSGKQHQKQAYLLADAGSAAEATAENEQAIAEYRKAIASRSNFPEAHENLGVALYNTEKPSEAMAEYETAMKQYDKPSSQVLTNYGMALIALNRFREAADSFSRALVIEPSDADLHYYRGFALHFAGDAAGAKSAFEKYLEVAPQGQHARDVREILAGRATPGADSGQKAKPR
jgi:eukaryotic-like serine/threonine-protein kinase